jgi:transposase
VARRVEVITGGGGQRRWSEDEEARAIEESLAPAAVVSEVARRHGVTPQQLFTWRRRREAPRKAIEGAEISPPFAPVVLAGPAIVESTASATPKSETSAAAVMEIDFHGAHIWIWRRADIGITTATLRVLQNAKTSGDVK